MLSKSLTLMLKKRCSCECSFSIPNLIRSSKQTKPQLFHKSRWNVLRWTYFLLLPFAWETVSVGACIWTLASWLVALVEEIALLWWGALLEEASLWEQPWRVYRLALLLVSLCASCGWMAAWPTSFQMVPPGFPDNCHAFCTMINSSLLEP